MSTIIIRLQNLPLSAKAADIREFFGDLKIPKGSVNIVGGQHGDAFIGFASDEDARLAMLLDGRLLHNSKIHLMLSSRREMEQVITNAQAHALNLGTMPAAIKQETKEQPPAAPGFNGLPQIKKEPKLEVFSSTPSGSSSSILTAPSGSNQSQSSSSSLFPFSTNSSGSIQQQQQPAAFPQSQQQQQPSPAAFGEDSWKNPLLSSQPPQFQQQQPPASMGGQQQMQMPNQAQMAQQPPPVFPGSVAAGGGRPFGAVQQPPPPQQQHQYQQLSMPPPPQQPPGFPPPIGQPPNMLGGGQPQQQQMPPGAFTQMPPPNLRAALFPPPAGNSSIFGFPTQTGPGPAPGGPDPSLFGQQQRFSQPPPPQSQFGPPQQQGNQPPPPHLQQQPQQQPFYGNPGGQQQQQPNFGGGNGGPRHGGPGGSHPQFRGGPGQQQQQFGRRPPFGQQQQQPRFGGPGGGGGGQRGHGPGGQQQRPAGGGFRGGFGQQQQRFGGGGPNQQNNNQQFQQHNQPFGGGQKRRNSRSPDGPNKRFNMPPRMGGGGGFGGQQHGHQQNQQHFGQQQQLQQAGEKQRICVQLSNVPYKATYDDIQDYLSTIKTRCIKCTRVYSPDKNYSDRWIVEFDNEEDARAVIRYKGEIPGRTIKFKIRAEVITPRRADEQYAVAEPEERDRDNTDGNGRRPRRDRDRGDGGRRGDRSRSRNRDRSRSRSRSPIRERSRDREWPRKDRERGGGARNERPNRSPSPIREKESSKRTSSRERQRSGSQSSSGGGGDRSPSSRGRERQQRRKLSPIEVNTAAAGTLNNNDEQDKKDKPLSANTTTTTLPPLTSGGPPVPLFGAFAFSGAPTTQPIPLRAFDAQPPQYFPRPPSLIGALNGNGNGHQNHNNNNHRNSPPTPSATDAQQSLPFLSHPPPLSAPVSGNNSFWQHQQPPSTSSQSATPLLPLMGSGKSATGANACPLGARAANGGVPSMPNNNNKMMQQQPPAFDPLFGIGANMNSGQPALVIVDNSSLDEEGFEESMNDNIGGIGTEIRQKAESLTTQQQKQHQSAEVTMTKSGDILSSMSSYSFPRNFQTTLTTASLSAMLSAIPDQPPLDLLEPENNGGGNGSDNHQMMQQQLQEPQSSNFNPPPDPRPPRIPAPAPPTMVLERRSFDSIPISAATIQSSLRQQQQQKPEFSPQEVELRPHLLFLEHYRKDPNAKSCIRLENVLKMVFVEQLAEFFGVKIESPCENIARMFNGVLYINLESEMLAAKAASRNGQYLNGCHIVITQLKKSEMADAIRQNMIIIREMYRVTVVARGFPLMVQPGEVVGMFERFNVNRDGVEKCAVKSCDTISTFMLTFPSVQDCRNAIRELNGMQISSNGGARLEVFQPEAMGI